MISPSPLRQLLRPKDLPARRFRSAKYWSRRYAAGGNSGAGSYGRLAQFKANTVNAFVCEHKVGSVIEFGCGDGNQLSLAQYPKYLGIDVAPVCVERCRRLFANDPAKTFKEVYRGERAELALSLDVIYHLVEDRVYSRYMRDLFKSATRYVVIYSSCKDESGEAKHVRHRRFTDWIGRHARGWRLFTAIPNPYPLRSDPENETFAEFYIFKKIGTRRRLEGFLRDKALVLRSRYSRIRYGQAHSLPGKLVVSLTSYPPRFPTLDLTLRCLLSQTTRPDSLILWVATEDHALLPRRVKNLQRHGLVIRQCEDIGPYKKIIPALREFPDAFIVTADDDVSYPQDWLHQLANAHRNESEIICHHARLVRLNSSGFPLPYRQWEHATLNEASREIFPVGVGGTLYPPGVLPAATLDQRDFLRLCPQADDVWLYWMAARAARTFRRVGPTFKPTLWPGSQGVGLQISNVYGHGNDRQIALMIAEYGMPSL